ncbi:type II secretion system protein [Photobacterium profundum]|uniref:Hypothetical MSHA pilin protein MshA n=1 Tax=Photobacterium profundum (strain SS9) TaxID=298386 RepID=Q6LLC2_PHOPR|nr:type II secretion system protein [Photobacterium profundum]CAG22084.1 hypothetical MSHA pilin protein MshA [Photobacterium profundum SS9]
MRRNGFTLIELVVVIVLLGILAVTAAPRFLNLQTDARNAALEGLKGSIESGLGIGYGKMAVAGVESVPHIISHTTDSDYTDRIGAIPIPGCEASNHDSCSFRFGYPESDFYTMTTLIDGINKHYETTKDWGITRQGTEGDITITSIKNLDYSATPPVLINNNCYLKYSNPTSTESSYSLDVEPCQ